MFVAIPKFDDEIHTGYYELCLIVQSKAQAKRILIQSNKDPREYEILEIKEKKDEQ